LKLAGHKWFERDKERKEKERERGKMMLKFETIRDAQN